MNRVQKYATTEFIYWQEQSIYSMLESNGRMDVIEFNLKHVDFKLTSFHKQREARFQVFKIVLCLRTKEQYQYFIARH